MLLPPASMAILPGLPYTLFLVRVGVVRKVLSVRSSQFVRGLRLCCDLVSFADIQRDEDLIDELLPWAGNV